MKKEDIIIGVHTSSPNDEEAKSLIVAFIKNGLHALSYEDCLKKKIQPHMTIGYDSAGLPHWQKILNNNIINILWSKDSVFSNNINFIEQFSSFSNFILFTPTPSDTEPVLTFFPKLKQGYLPIGNHKSAPEEKEKEYDFVILGNIIDVEEKMDELEAKMPEFVYKLMHDILTISLENPNLSFWQIYTLFRDNIGLKVDFEQYVLLFTNLAHLITSQKQIELVDRLKDYNVKVFGNEVWKKYLSGNAEYMGHGNKEVISKAKILLHAHPIELSLGLHENVLEAAASHTFVLSSNTKSIELEFKDSMGYFNYSKLDDVTKKADYFLKKEKERIEKAKKAFHIVHKKHSIENRVSEIIKIMS